MAQDFSNHDSADITVEANEEIQLKKGRRYSITATSAGASSITLGWLAASGDTAIAFLGSDGSYPVGLEILTPPSGLIHVATDAESTVSIKVLPQFPRNH